MLAHPAAAISEVLKTLPRWKIPAHILGRIVGLIQPRHNRQYRLRVAAAAVEAAAAKSAWQVMQSARAGETVPSNDQQNIRVDASHKAVGRSEKHHARASRRQKSR